VTAPRRPGRRPGASGARDDILAAARELFAARGFDGTTIRAVASVAGVDPALVHHYFGSKQHLFAEAVELPADPHEVLAPVYDAPVDDLGRALATALLALWDSPHRDRIVALVRTRIAGDGGLLRTFLRDVALGPLLERIDVPTGSAAVRAELVISQMAGIMVTRYLLELEPLASLPSERVVEIVAPTLQRYFTGDL